MPRLLREIIRGVLDTDPAFEYAGEIEDLAAAGDVVARRHIDFVVTTADSPEACEHGGHLIRDRRVRVLGVTSDARQTFLHVPLGEVAPQRLLGVMRTATKPPLGGGG